MKSSTRAVTEPKPDRMQARVAIVFRLDRPGGVQSCCFSIIKGLNGRGIIPDVLWDVEPDKSLLESLGIEVRYRPLRFPVPTRVIDRLPTRLRYLAWSANTIRGERYRHDYDFFYLFYNGFLMSPGIPHVRYMPVPPFFQQVNGEGSTHEKAFTRAYRWFYEELLRAIGPLYRFHRGDHYVTISEFTREIFQQVHGVNLPIIYPPIKLCSQSYDLDDMHRRDTLTFFSRIVDYKRPEMLLELACRFPNLRCVMMGGVAPFRQAYFQDLQNKAHQMGLKNLVFLANPSNERVLQELARTKFYLFPAINEHFGMTTPEAIASCAVPFVHDSGGQKEIVVDDRLRFLDHEFLQKFTVLANLSDLELNELRQRLNQHIQTFSEEVFITKMLYFLDLS